MNILDNLDNLDSVENLDNKNRIDNADNINSLQKIFNLIDILIKDIYKPEISLLDLLNEIYIIIDIIQNNKSNIGNYKKYQKIYNGSRKIELDNICSCLIKNKTYKHLVKEYFTIFKYDNEIINNIQRIINELLNKNIGILNLFSGTGSLIRSIIDSIYNLEYKYIEFWDQDDSNINLLKLINTFKNTYINKTDIIHSNDIKNGHDIIIANIPDNIKNIIYSKCCDKIKELKIRGTKSEPLIVQLIMQLLKSNGTAIIIVANSFLFGDSKQHIDTRKFIYENSSNIEIIHLKSNKLKSILVFTKTTNNISNNLILSNNKIKHEIIIKNNYSFYYPNYILEIESNNDNLITLNEIIEIQPFDININSNIKTNLLYSLNNIFYIGNNIPKYDYLFLTNNEEK
jgi:hypothetical protein